MTYLDVWKSGTFLEKQQVHYQSQTRTLEKGEGGRGSRRNINTCMNITCIKASSIDHPPPHLHRLLQSDHSLQFHLLCFRVQVQALDVIRTLLEMGLDLKPGEQRLQLC